jgi:hypothetical protein
MLSFVRNEIEAKNVAKLDGIVKNDSSQKEYRVDFMIPKSHEYNSIQWIVLLLNFYSVSHSSISNKN